MKAVIVKQPGGADQLQITEQAKPIPKDGELLIKVKAAAVNRTDIVHREKNLGYMDNPIISVEVAGTVEEVGTGAGAGFKVGTRVWGL